MSHLERKSDPLWKKIWAKKIRGVPTYMHNPWTQTTVWGKPGWDGEGKMGDICNIVNNKKIEEFQMVKPI